MWYQALLYGHWSFIVPEETPTKATENEDEPMETEENEKASEEPAKSIDESEKKSDEELV